MNQEERRRLVWVKMYEQSGDAGRVCRRCGISRATLRKWVRRYQQQGEKGLSSLSRRPHHSPKRKVMQEDVSQILELRHEGKGARRIQNELRLYRQKDFSLATIHKVLSRAEVIPIIKVRRPVVTKRYNRPIPGERIQMDTMKIAEGRYQYTAVDDCSRFRVLGLYPRRDGFHTLHFLDRVVEEMPFPIQRIQTDRGGEFFADEVQKRLMELFIKFRPIPPRSPHLNGKVERSQLTDRLEFWSRCDWKTKEIEQRLEEWQFEYNWRRPHGSLNGKTPADRLAEIGELVPLSEEVALLYDINNERIRHSDWTIDQAISALHFYGCRSQK